MAQADGLNSNSLRGYPLAEPADLPMAGPAGPTVLPYSALLDFFCVLGPGIPATTAISLTSVARTGDLVVFTFVGDGPLAGHPVSFARTLNAPEFAVDRQSVSGVIAGLICTPSWIWDATLTTGNLAELAAVLGDGQTLTAEPGYLPLEPRVVQAVGGTQVQAIHLANRARTQVTAPAGCGTAPPPAVAAGTIVATATCLKGDIRLSEGTNCLLTLDTTRNTITIGASSGAGAGSVCAEIPAYPGEAPPAGSSLLTGGPACNEIISGINGAAGTALDLATKAGVSVKLNTDDPSTLEVTFSGQGLANCT